MMSHITHFFLFLFSHFLPIKLEIARSEMYHYRICVRRGARRGEGGDLSATDEGLWGNKACMRSCFPPLNGVSMSPGPRVARRLSEVVDFAWPSCIISLLIHVGCVSQRLSASVHLYLLVSSCVSFPKIKHRHTQTHAITYIYAHTHKICTPPTPSSFEFLSCN